MTDRPSPCEGCRHHCSCTGGAPGCVKWRIWWIARWEAARQKLLPPEPPKLREWLHLDGCTVCPECGYTCKDDWWLGEGNFCPTCGERLARIRVIMDE